jgi:hypothetical protein
VELTYLMLTGSLSGLLSVLAHSVVGSTVELVRGQLAAGAPARHPLQISEALVHMFSGIGLGLLFWLSWGFAAVVDVPWWVRGLSFGSLCWLALAVPSIVSLVLMRGVSAGLAVIAASRWASTCLIAALACAWSWDKSM